MSRKATYSSGKNTIGVMIGHVSLLNAIASRDANWLEPTYKADTQTVHHPVVGGSPGVLKTLFDRGLLDREFVERVIACPDCGIDHLDFELQCPDCHSGNTVAVDIYEHTTCGCVRPREAFIEDDPDRCPECGSDIESFAEECERMGTMHQCRACDGRFDSLTEYLDCPNCETYTLADVNTYRLHRYRFDEDRREYLAHLVAIRDELATVLETNGYDVDFADCCTDLTSQPDLRAIDPTLDIDLAIEIRDSIDIETITDLQTVVEDTEARPVIATVGEAGSAGALAEEHGITVVELDVEDDRTLHESTSVSHRRAIDGLFADIPDANDSRASLPQ